MGCRGEERFEEGEIGMEKAERVQLSELYTEDSGSLEGEL